MAKPIAALSDFVGWMLIGPIWVYKKALSPLIGQRCRYQPTCSTYAIEAIQKRGPIVGFWLAARRITRCHPWGGHGYDPVPTLEPEPSRTPVKDKDL